MKKLISTALCTATAMAAMLAMPTAAQAADPHPEFYASTQHEQVVLYVESLKRPAGLKVHLRKKGTAQRVLTVSEFVSMPYDDPCSEAASCMDPSPFGTAPLKLAALGEYDVDVEYTGTQGEPILHKNKTTLNYRLRPLFSNVKNSKPELSLADRDTVVSGDINLYDPRDSSTKPLTGGAVTTVHGAAPASLTTDANGHFEGGITANGSSGFRNDDGKPATSIGLATEVNGARDTDYFEVSVAPVETRVALDSTNVSGPYGTEAKVTGTVTYESPEGTWKPVPAGIDVSVGFKQVLTDDSGRFTRTTQLSRDTTWEAQVKDQWAQSQAQSVTLTVGPGTTFNRPTAWVSASKTVSVTGALGLYRIPAGITSLKVDVQYSADGQTGWTTRKSVDVALMPGTNPGSSLTLPVRTTLPYPGAGHLRLQYAGMQTLHGSTSSTVKAVRTMTAIPEFNAAPEPVKKGKPITITGKLNHADPTWKPFAGQTVHYYFRPAGTFTWKVMGYSKTAADGTFTKTFTATQTGYWQARYALADDTHFIAAGRVDGVIVTP
ncbi:hypothetical protein OHA37_21290 [Streptomyces sp. NBC_00335]|uniref:hypothetical protein n=1 Tax=unclassified Streptomyces TaxID=2593676 RepID=UPI00224D4A66|nr:MULTISPECIES: hypothetical protein [unclassified Streptomyces]MCX5406397.1 hypothetical protein [Streptomyces sp. NBC_00086]